MDIVVIDSASAVKVWATGFGMVLVPWFAGYVYSVFRSFLTV